MQLPPLSYFLLLAVTLAALPFILRAAPAGASRRWAAWLLGGLLLVEAGLILLFYAKIFCWPLVALGVAGMAAAGRRRPGMGTLVLLAPAVAAGAAFEALPGLQGFYFYFGFAFPFLLSAGLVTALSRHPSAAEPRALLPVAGLLLFAAFAPASAFGFTFLTDFEVYHLPFLFIALLGISFLARRGGPGPMRVPADMGATIAERLAAPWRTSMAAGAVFVLSGVGVGFLALRHAPLAGLAAMVAWSCVLVALFLGVLAVVLRARGYAGLLLIAAGASAAIGALLGVRYGAEAFHVFVGGGPAPETVLFYIAGSGLFLLALATLWGLARARERAARARLAREPSRLVQTDGSHTALLPSGFVVEQMRSMPGVGELQAFRARLRAQAASGGVVEVTGSSLDPLEGLPDDVSDWLSRQATLPLVHVAVREGREVFFEPFIDPVEGRE